MIDSVEMSVGEAKDEKNTKKKGAAILERFSDFISRLTGVISANMREENSNCFKVECLISKSLLVCEAQPINAAAKLWCEPL